MSKQLKIKDPVYGYIYFSSEIEIEIIDSAQFQRLRDIKQTGYSSLYPASIHNRFVHSIGTYYLSTIVVDTLKKISELQQIKNFEEYCFVFELACLLHDVGHAPFSHAGEYFFEPIDPWLLLANELQSEEFTEQITKLVIEYYKEQDIDLFGLDSLLTTGQQSDKDCEDTVRLLADSDILHIAKSRFYSERCVVEYFNRSKRMKPIWKTESEYRLLFENGLYSEVFYDKLQGLLSDLNSTVSFYGTDVIDDSLEKKINKTLSDLKQKMTDIEVEDNNLEYDRNDNRKKSLEESLRIISILKKVTKDANIPFRFVLLERVQFYSGYNKDSFKKLLVDFDGKNVELQKVLNLFEQEKPRKKFFYLYIPSESRRSFDLGKMLSELSRMIIKDFQYKN